MKNKISRRQFLQVTGASAAGFLLRQFRQQCEQFFRGFLGGIVCCCVQ